MPRLRAPPLLLLLLTLLLLSATHAGAGCTLDGRWTYTPECGHDYTWKVEDEVLQCFAGKDGWLRAKGWISGHNLTLSFGDNSCPGAGAVKVRKWGTINTDCSVVTMHDTGSPTYKRLPPGPPPPCPKPPPAPPVPPPPPPCPSSGKPVDVEWLSCRTAQIIKGCVEDILPTSKLNKGINGPSHSLVSFHRTVQPVRAIVSPGNSALTRQRAVLLAAQPLPRTLPTPPTAMARSGPVTSSTQSAGPPS